MRRAKYVLISRLLFLSLASIWLVNPVKAENEWRVAPDLIFKSQWLSESEPSPGKWASVGVDAYRQFGSDDKTYMTATIQLYQWCVSDRLRKPGVLKGLDDCELVSKASTLEFHVSGDGRFNILVGHPELPYGLEVPVATNETIRTLLTPRDTGLKLDWGVGVKGTIDEWAYAATITRGSGFEWENESKTGETPWAFAGRIGSATDAQRFLPNAGVGFSVFAAEALNPAGQLVERWRTAVDWVDYFGPVGVMSQISIGETEGRQVANGFLELNRSDSSEQFTAYLQYKTFNEEFRSGWEKADSVHLGARYALSDRISISMQVTRELDVFGGMGEQNVLDVQFRFRGE